MSRSISRSLDSVVALNTKVTKVDMRGFRVSNTLLAADKKVDELCLWLIKNRPGQWVLKRHFVAALFNNERRFYDTSPEVRGQLKGWIARSRERLERDGIYIQFKNGAVRPTFSDDDTVQTVLSPKLRQHTNSGRKIESIIGNVDKDKLEDPDNIKIVKGTNEMLRVSGSHLRLLTSSLDEQRRVLKEKVEAFEKSKTEDKGTK